VAAVYTDDEEDDHKRGDRKTDHREHREEVPLAAEETDIRAPKIQRNTPDDNDKEEHAEHQNDGAEIFDIPDGGFVPRLPVGGVLPGKLCFRAAARGENTEGFIERDVQLPGDAHDRINAGVRGFR